MFKNWQKRYGTEVEEVKAISIYTQWNIANYIQYLKYKLPALYFDSKTILQHLWVTECRNRKYYCYYFLKSRQIVSLIKIAGTKLTVYHQLLKIKFTRLRNC